MAAELRILATILTILIIDVSAGAAVDMSNQWTVTSPDGHLSITIAQKRLEYPYPPYNNLYYSVRLDANEILPYAPLGVVSKQKEDDFTNDLSFVHQSDKIIDETYPMVSGKKSVHRNFANEKTLVFKNPQGKTVHVIFRVYNDGIAYRYHLPGMGGYEIYWELSGFKFPAGTVGWFQQYTNRQTYQDFYHKQIVDKSKGADIGFPALFHTTDGVWVLLTEAAVYGDYGGCHLYGPVRGSPVFSIQLPHRLRGKLPWTTPWRVAIIGKNPGIIVESVLVDNLNPPCEVKDTSWIKPGRVTFPWWSDHQVSEKPERLKTFIDFASGMGWEWIEFDTGVVGGRTIDTTTPWVVKTTDAWMTAPWVPELVKYANSKGVNVYGWDNWEALDAPKEYEKVLTKLNKFGIKGIKIDYLNSDSQDMFQFRDEIIKACLKHRLMVSFHGETIPRGQRRRWPNIMTWEAVVGAEGYTYGQSPTPVHNCMLPFTRNVVGPMDYTPVIFSTEGLGYREPFSIKDKTTTDAHELALSVIFESGWQCIADSPEAYAASAGKPFLKTVPATWDDIHFIDGYPGEFVCLARRKNNDWFIAALNTETARTIKISLDFLRQGSYSVKLYRDGQTGKGIAVEEIVLDANKPFEISMPPNGGFCTQIVNSYDTQ